MKIASVLKEVLKSAVFKTWKKDHKDYFLAHLFKMLDEENAGSWQVGLCNPESNSIMTFIYDQGEVKTLEESKPFSQPGSKIKELNMEGVAVDFQEALETANKTMKEKHSKELTLKRFFILQNIEGHQLYNITYFTQTFKTINIRVSAEDGKILKDVENQFFSFDGKKEN
jgi:hypothetical protein